MVVKKNKKDISSKSNDPLEGFINALNKQLSSKDETKNLMCKEVVALTKMIDDSERYFITHENKESISQAAFSVYDVLHCCEEPVLRIMQSQIPPKCYKNFVTLVNSEDNLEKADLLGITKNPSENEYFSNTHDFDE